MTLPLRRNPETRHDWMQKLRYQYSFEQKHKFTNQHEITTQSRFFKLFKCFFPLFQPALGSHATQSTDFQRPHQRHQLSLNQTCFWNAPWASGIKGCFFRLICFLEFFSWTHVRKLFWWRKAQVSELSAHWRDFRHPFSLLMVGTRGRVVWRHEYRFTFRFEVLGLLFVTVKWDSIHWFLSYHFTANWFETRLAIMFAIVFKFWVQCQRKISFLVPFALGETSTPFILFTIISSK